MPRHEVDISGLFSVFVITVFPFDYSGIKAPSNSRFCMKARRRRVGMAKDSQPGLFEGLVLTFFPANFI